MESAMGVKDAVKTLLDELPDDCTIEDVIRRLLLLETVDRDQSELSPLTQAQRDALDAELDRLEREPESGIPWREALRRIERRE